MKSTPKKRSKPRKKRRHAAPYDFEFKLKVVRLYLEEKYRGRTARRRTANANLLRFAGKALGNAVIVRRAKAWRDLARLFGTAGYILGVPASRTLPEARPPHEGAP